MGLGVPLPAKSNSWVVVLLYGAGCVGFWIQYCVALTDALDALSQQLGGSVTARCWILAGSGRCLAKIASG